MKSNGQLGSISIAIQPAPHPLTHPLHRQLTTSPKSSSAPLTLTKHSSPPRPPSSHSPARPSPDRDSAEPGWSLAELSIDHDDGLLLDQIHHLLQPHPEPHPEPPPQPAMLQPAELRSRSRSPTPDRCSSSLSDLLDCYSPTASRFPPPGRPTAPAPAQATAPPLSHPSSHNASLPSPPPSASAIATGLLTVSPPDDPLPPDHALLSPSPAPPQAHPSPPIALHSPPSRMPRLPQPLHHLRSRLNLKQALPVSDHAPYSPAHVLPPSPPETSRGSTFSSPETPPPTSLPSSPIADRHLRRPPPDANSAHAHSHPWTRSPPATSSSDSEDDLPLSRLPCLTRTSGASSAPGPAPGPSPPGILSRVIKRYRSSRSLRTLARKQPSTGRDERESLRSSPSEPAVASPRTLRPVASSPNLLRLGAQRMPMGPGPFGCGASVVGGTQFLQQQPTLINSGASSSVAPSVRSTTKCRTGGACQGAVSGSGEESVFERMKRRHQQDLQTQQVQSNQSVAGHVPLTTGVPVEGRLYEMLSERQRAAVRQRSRALAQNMKMQLDWFAWEMVQSNVQQQQQQYLHVQQIHQQQQQQFQMHQQQQQVKGRQMYVTPPPPPPPPLVPVPPVSVPVPLGMNLQQPMFPRGQKY